MLGLKLHVLDDKQKSWLGEFLLEFVENSSFPSFVLDGQIDRGLRATLPGVKLGSSSIVLIWDPCWNGENLMNKKNMNK